MIAPEDDRESRLNELLLCYFEAMERGESPQRRDLIDAHPEFAEELTSFFEDLEAVNRFAAPLREAAFVEPSSAPRPVDKAAFWNDREADPAADPNAVGPAVSSGDLGRIGDFRLIREVGRGGMGVVYEAEQLSLRRRVALKILPFAAAFDARHLQRFRNEALAAAQLHHTTIVPVYAVGAEAGVHYYAMQFIDGQSLAELIGGLRSLNDHLGARAPDATAAEKSATERQTPNEVLQSLEEPLRTERLRHERLLASPLVGSISSEHHLRATKRCFFERVARLGAQVAEGLDHAHQLGVIHRDVKPANLMIDARGEVWIADFGLAMFRDDVELTMTGELIGTLRFMSPEQGTARRGLVDHRTDIYSLGVTLYELLTLTPAFAGSDRHELLRRIVLEEPKALRSIDPTIPRELETVILKAIAKEPGERYATAQEMANDLHRFIDDRPVLARRPSWNEAAMRWARRHNGIVVASVAALLATVLALAVFASVLAQEHALTTRALDGQRQKAREAEEQRALAEANFESARKAVDFFAELSREELLEHPPMWEVRRKVLEASVRYYRELSHKRPGDPALQTELIACEARLVELVNERAAMVTLDLCLLLNDPAVQQELQLSADQLEQLPDLVEPMIADFVRRLPAEDDDRAEFRRTFIAHARRAQSQIASFLHETQSRRLRQIALQQPSPFAFASGETLDALELTDEQRQQVRDIQAATVRKMARSMRPGQKWEDFRDEHLRDWKDANLRIVSLFTPAQFAMWSEMIGAPFASSPDRFRQPLVAPAR